MKKNIVIIILAILVLGLVSYIVTDKIIENNRKDSKTTNISETQNVEETNENISTNSTYKEYKKGEEVTLKDGSKWFVLADSNSSEDSVKLMSVDQIYLNTLMCDEYDAIYCIDESSYDFEALSIEYFGAASSYKGSIIESLLNSFAEKIPAKLKTVDGYKIRLLSINDLLEYDSKWDNNFTYTGTFSEFPEVFYQVWLMDIVENRCGGSFQENGRCTGNMGAFYVVRLSYDYDLQKMNGIYLGPGASGIAPIKPVIYALKSSL